MEAELAEVNWRVRWDDIMFGAQEKRKLERSGSRLSLARVLYLTIVATSFWSTDHVTIAVHRYAWEAVIFLPRFFLLFEGVLRVTAWNSAEPFRMLGSLSQI